MALTLSEQQELAQLESLTAKPQVGGLTASEQQELADLESMAAPKMSKVEASLGMLGRAQYALEPIEANREALLKQQYGQENVMRGPEGDLYLKQEGAFRPVNMPGIGMTDVAELAGSLPEVIPEAIGGLIGGGAGLAVGAPTGPGAVATGALGLAGGRAIGGGLGSLFRQGLSAAVGTPQVATLGERALETGMSALTAPIGGAIADKFLRGAIKAPLAEAVQQAPVEKILPGIPSSIAAPVQAIAPDVAQMTRPMVQDEFKRLSEIATRQGLPAPTYAQAASGKAILAEQQLLNTPLIGSKARKQVDEQLKAVKKNLEDVAGAFLDADSDAYEVGLNTKKMSDEVIRSTKDAATTLYKQVEDLGANATVGKANFFNKYRDFAGKYGLINPDLSPTKYAADTGLTRETFDQLQRVAFDGIDAIKKSKSPKVQFEAINALRKTLRSQAEELRPTNRNAARIVDELYQSINETAQRSLDRESPRLSGVFKEANKTYKKYLDYEEFASKALPEGQGEEKYIKRLMSDTKNIDQMKDIIGDDRMKEIGVSYVRDILSKKLSGAGVARASMAKSELQKVRPQLISAFGEKSYSKLIENLDYLNRVNQPLIPNRESLYNLFNESTGGLKGAGMRIASAGKAMFESGRIQPIQSVKKATESIQKIPLGPISRSNIGNILTSQKQTELNK